MPGGEKVHGSLEAVEHYHGSHMLLIRDGHDFEYKWFQEHEVKIRLRHKTKSTSFTLWQLNALLGYPTREWSWDGDLLSDVYEYFSGNQTQPDLTLN